MTLLFLRTGEGKEPHAILNTNQICFMEGFKVTDEHPLGAETRIVFSGGAVSIQTPFKELADQIAKTIEQAYVLNEQLNAANREASAKIQREVLTEFLAGKINNT